MWRPAAQPSRRNIRRGFGAVALTPAQQQQISELGINPATVANYAAQVQADGPLVGNAVTALAQGNTAKVLQDCIPIIGGAVAVAATPIAGAIVGGVLQVGLSVAEALGLFSQQTENCSWKFPPTPAGQPGACFGESVRPYGPASPTWVSLQTFANSYSSKTNPWIDVYWKPEYSPVSWLDDTVFNGGDTNGYFQGPGWLIAPELALLGDKGPLAMWWANNSAAFLTAQVQNNVLSPTGILAKMRSFWSYAAGQAVSGKTSLGGNVAPTSSQWRWTTPGLQAFALVFNRVWQAALEYPINGWAMPVASGGTVAQPAGLLQFTANAWNSKFPLGTPTTIDGLTMSSDGYYMSFADMCVAGLVDRWVVQGSTGNQSQPVTVNDPGNLLSTVVTGNQASTVSPLAVVGAGAGLAAVGTLGYAAATGQSPAAVIAGAGDVLKSVLGALPNLLRGRL